MLRKREKLTRGLAYFLIVKVRQDVTNEQYDQIVKQFRKRKEGSNVIYRHALIEDIQVVDLK